MAERDPTRAIIFRRRAAFIAASLAGAGCASAVERAEPTPEVSAAQPAEPAAIAEPTATPVAPPPTSAPAPTALVRVCLSITIVPRVEFEAGTSVPTPESLAVVAAAYETLATHPGTRVAIEGHRDASEPDLAHRLARERANVVVQQLTTRGIDPARLCTTDFGDSRPLTRGRDEHERARNRRVEFRLLRDGEDCP